MISLNRPARPRRSTLALLTVAAVGVTSAAIATPATAIPATATPAVVATAIYQDPTQPVPARVADLLPKLSLADKIGQMLQTEQPTTTPAELATYKIGSLLSGGGSDPSPNTPTAWADMYDRYQATAMSQPLGIPMIYGIDAVHGHSNVVGATIFPHNVGLGAAHDPALVQRIGRATAEEMAGTGIRWNFAPCLCVVRDDHWGRTYESYGEKPEDAVRNASIITGLQGTSLANADSVMATAKHYLGDGGTAGGLDEKDTVISEEELRAIHLPPFTEAVRRGVGAVMVSYSSWNGAKMHGNRYLLTDVLKGELGFSGIVISDWNAVEYVDGAQGFTAQDVRDSVNAGVDMLMITEAYPKIIELLTKEVQDGRVPMSRIDDAVTRILTKKFELGLFEHPYADRSFLAGFGGAEHRAIAREAVQKSQVVLKNANNVLPLAKSPGKIFVAGKSADDIGMQSGGWTISWQGKPGNTTPGTTILQGIKNTVAAGATVTYNKTGVGIDSSYQAAIAVIGELPYAEYEGDRKDDLRLDKADRDLLTKLKATGVPVIVVLVSGRTLDISNEVGDMSALIASWLPGTEGQGVADILFGNVAPTGKLTLTWMKNAAQQPINDGDGKPALFPYGAGLTWPATPPVTPSPSIPPTVSPTPSVPQTPAVDARSTVRASTFTGQLGVQTETCSDEGCGQNVGWIAPGDQLWYDDVDFGATSPTSVQSRIASGGSSGTIEYRLDSATGPLIGSAPVTSTGGWTSWTTATTALTGAATGRHRLYAVFTGPGGDFVNVNWFRFS
jgi:beta-glucosidase